MKEKQKLLALKILFIALGIICLFLPFHKITINKGAQESIRYITGIVIIPLHFSQGNILAGILISLLHIAIPIRIYKIISNKLLARRMSAAPKRRENSMLQVINDLKKPARQLIRANGPCFSKIGGLPEVSEDFAWPKWKDRKLSFIAQIDFSEMKSKPVPELPNEGVIYIFYDQNQETWGFDPKDRDSWRVIYEPGQEGVKTAERPDDLADEALYGEKRIQFRTVHTYPNWEHNVINEMDLPEEELEELDNIRMAQFEGETMHQMFGWPDPVQSANMQDECQLASKGIYCGDAKQYNDPKSKELLKDANEWILLLQIDSDDEIGMMWGDMGKLYFWIRKEDLKASNFDNVWMILQCG